MGETLACSSIARNLASCDRQMREKSLRALGKWFASHPDISDAELRWIWKGLFYCLWHADNQAGQIDVINLLSSFLVSLELSIATRYFEVFLSTMRREWSGIDHLRLDKFYLLIRKFVYHLFLLLRRHSWDSQVLKNLMDVFSERALLVADKNSAQGFSYHISDVFLVELKGFLPLNLETLDDFFSPFLLAMAKSPDKVLLNRIKLNMFSCLLDNGRKLLEQKKQTHDACVCSEVENLGTISLTMGFAKKFFDLASSPETLQGNRKFLFSLHEDFLKLESILEKSDVQIMKPCAILTLGDVDSKLDAELDFFSDVDRLGGPTETPSKNKRTKKTSTGAVDESEKKAQITSITVGSESVVETMEGNDDVLNNSEETPGESETQIALDESVISNLQKQFEKVAAEVGMDVDDAAISGKQITSENGATLRKRKRATNMAGGVRLQASDEPCLLEENTPGENENEKKEDKSAKKVRFAMKNNLVWKPHNPLPPQSLRLPPSATPRGSALKKGIPPGPVSVTPKKARRKAALLKKGRKSPKSVSPAVKKFRKLQTLSA